MNDLSKNTVSYLEIGEDSADQRLDNFLIKHLKGVPKSHVYRIIRSGEIRVNGKRAEASNKLFLGAKIRLPPIRTAEKENNNESPEIHFGKQQAHFPIIYEDDYLLVINKPSGIAVHGGSGLSFGVIEALRAQRQNARFLELIHRLDKETSGLLMIAKKRSALVKLQENLRRTGNENERIDKHYLCLVNGRFADEKRHCKAPLFKYLLPSGERRVRVSPEGKAAHTIFRLVQNWQNMSLLSAELKTGRTHQIRVHAASLGHFIIGDEKYGDEMINATKQKLGLKRLFLHAEKLSFLHPVTNEKLNLHAPMPEELQNFLDKLKAK